MSKARELILEAGRLQIARNGIKGVQVVSLCEQAKVPRTTFYREFSNSQEVVVTVIKDYWATSVANIADEVISLPSEVRWSQFFIRLLTKVAKQPSFLNDENILPIVRLINRHYIAQAHEIGRGMHFLIVEGQKDGTVRNDVSVDEIAHWVLRQSWSLSSLPLIGEETEEDLEHYIDRFFLPALRGMQTIPVHQVLIKLDSIDERLKKLEPIINRN